MNWTGENIECRRTIVMRTRTDIGVLRHDNVVADYDFSQRIESDIVTDPTPVSNRQFPRERGSLPQWDESIHLRRFWLQICVIANVASHMPPCGDHWNSVA